MTTTLRKSALGSLAMTLAMVMGAAAPAFGHELFLKAEKSVVPPASDQVITLINGAFDKSENSIGRERMQNVSIVANGATTNPPNSAWSDDIEKTVSILKYRAGDPGTYVIGLSTKPKILTLSAKDFIEYLKHDGVLDTLASFEKQSKLTQVRERYSKHVRAIVQVGDKKTADFAKPLGYPVEILLEQNPYDLKTGSELRFRVLFQGKPVANQFVKASYDGFHGHDASGAHINAHELRTDKDGRAKLTLDKKGLWYISLIHMQQIKDPAADYESNWATATFAVR